MFFDRFSVSISFRFFCFNSCNWSWTFEPPLVWCPCWSWADSGRSLSSRTSCRRWCPRGARTQPEKTTFCISNIVMRDKSLVKIEVSKFTIKKQQQAIFVTNYLELPGHSIVTAVKDWSCLIRCCLRTKIQKFVLIDVLSKTLKLLNSKIRLIKLFGLRYYIALKNDKKRKLYRTKVLVLIGSSIECLATMND